MSSEEDTTRKQALSNFFLLLGYVGFRYQICGFYAVLTCKGIQGLVPEITAYTVIKVKKLLHF